MTGGSVVSFRAPRVPLDVFDHEPRDVLVGHTELTGSILVEVNDASLQQRKHVGLPVLQVGLQPAEERRVDSEAVDVPRQGVAMLGRDSVVLSEPLAEDVKQVPDLIAAPNPLHQRRAKTEGFQPGAGD